MQSPRLVMEALESDRKRQVERRSGSLKDTLANITRASHRFTPKTVSFGSIAQIRGEENADGDHDGLSGQRKSTCRAVRHSAVHAGPSESPKLKTRSSPRRLPTLKSPSVVLASLLRDKQRFSRHSQGSLNDPDEDNSHDIWGQQRHRGWISAIRRTVLFCRARSADKVHSGMTSSLRSTFIEPLGREESTVMGKVLLFPPLMKKSNKFLKCFDRLLVSASSPFFPRRSVSSIQGEILSVAATVVHQTKVCTIRTCWREHIEPLNKKYEQLRSAHESLKAQFSDMRSDYLKEVTMLRENLRVRGDPESFLVVNGKSLDVVAYLDPMNMLSSEEIEFALKVISEKLKMIFEANPTVCQALDFGQLSSLRMLAESHEIKKLKEQLRAQAIMLITLRSQLKRSSIAVAPVEPHSSETLEQPDVSPSAPPKCNVELDERESELADLRAKCSQAQAALLLSEQRVEELTAERERWRKTPEVDLQDMAKVQGSMEVEPQQTGSGWWSQAETILQQLEILRRHLADASVGPHIDEAIAEAKRVLRAFSKSLERSELEVHTPETQDPQTAALCRLEAQVAAFTVERDELNGRLAKLQWAAEQQEFVNSNVNAEQLCWSQAEKVLRQHVKQHRGATGVNAAPDWSSSLGEVSSLPQPPCAGEHRADGIETQSPNAAMRCGADLTHQASEQDDLCRNRLMMRISELESVCVETQAALRHQAQGLLLLSPRASFECAEEVRECARILASGVDDVCAVEAEKTDSIPSLSREGMVREDLSTSLDALSSQMQEDAAQLCAQLTSGVALDGDGEDVVREASEQLRRVTTLVATKFQETMNDWQEKFSDQEVGTACKCGSAVAIISMYKMLSQVSKLLAHVAGKWQSVVAQNVEMHEAFSICLCQKPYLEQLASGLCRSQSQVLPAVFERLWQDGLEREARQKLRLQEQKALLRAACLHLFRIPVSAKSEMQTNSDSHTLRPPGDARGQPQHAQVVEQVQSSTSPRDCAMLQARKNSIRSDQLSPHRRPSKTTGRLRPAPLATETALATGAEPAMLSVSARSLSPCGNAKKGEDVTTARRKSAHSPNRGTQLPGIAQPPVSQTTSAHASAGPAVTTRNGASRPSIRSSVSATPSICASAEPTLPSLLLQGHALGQASTALMRRKSS